MDHGYGGHPYPSAPQQQFPPPPLQQYAQGGAPPFFPPPPPMAPFPPYGPAGMPYPGAPFVPSIAGAPLQQQLSLPQGFFNPWDPPPPIAPPPSDAELQKRIDKLVEYAAKNGPDFEKMLKEKQKDNPLYAFLFGAEGYGYYRYKLWITVNPQLGGPFMTPPIPSISAPNANFNPALASMNTNVGVVNPSLNAPVVHPVSQGVYYDQQQQQVAQQHHQPYFEPSYQESAPAPKSFKGLSGPLPADVAMELQNVLDNLTGTKESIKGAKSWFMQRLPFAPALAEALRERVLSLDDDIRQLHIIYLANDILFDSLQRRVNLKELDNEALAFQPILGSMLAAIYHNPQNKEANQNRLQKILQFWGLKEVYNKEIISVLENEMVAGPSTSYRVPATLPGGQIEKPLPLNISAVTVAEPSGNKEHAHISTPDRAQSFQSPSGKEENPLLVALAAAQYGPTAASVSALNAPFVPFTTLAAGSSQSGTATQVSSTVRPTDHPPYPLFPPGLIPGMVCKMQIGTGVPYSALSPLDIPAVIPPSTVSDSYILDRVSKFFKDIGEVDPLEGQMKRSVIDDDEREEREWNRTGGACVPPPTNMAVDPETNTLPDGSVEHKPGSINTGRLGLGAVADPNEITQYDDVYTSYRKQRSTSYHSFMSARSAAR